MRMVLPCGPSPPAERPPAPAPSPRTPQALRCPETTPARPISILARAPRSCSETRRFYRDTRIEKRTLLTAVTIGLGLPLPDHRSRGREREGRRMLDER